MKQETKMSFLGRIRRFFIQLFNNIDKKLEAEAKSKSCGCKPAEKKDKSCCS
jgi:hypothetical protein